MTRIQEYAFPMQKDIQIAYGFTQNPNLEEGRRTFDVCYDLSKVFDKSFYRNGKSYKKHIGMYLNYADGNNLYVKEIETDEEREAVKELYNEWNTAKLEADRLNPNHFTEHSARYWNCLQLVFDKKLSNSGLAGLFDTEGHLLSYQMYSVKDDWMFGVTTATSKKYYTHLANVATASFLRYFKQRGFKFANWGETGGDKNLLAYKESYPNFRIYYGKLNLTFEKSTEKDIDEIVNFMKANSTEEIPFPTEYMPDSIKAGNVTKVLIDDKLVAMAELRSRPQGIRLMTNLITSPECRGQGIAKKLLDHLEAPFTWDCYKHNLTANQFYSNLEAVKRIGETSDGRSYSYVKWSTDATEQ